MELTSITEIRELKNSIKEQIAKVDKTAYKDSFFGQESEYTFRGLLGGVDCLLTDITTLTKAPNQFLKLSTYTERQSILTALRNLESYLESPNQLWQYLDNLKQAVRPFHIRYTQERLLDFDEKLSNVIRKKQLLEEEIEKVKSTKSENEELLTSLTEKNEELSDLLEKLNEKITNTDEKNDDVLEQISTLTEKISEGDELITTAKDTVESTNEQLEEAKSSTTTIQEFEENVENRQKQADEIDKRTQEYKTNIEAFEAEREKLNMKAKDTINEALKALEYNTARGLSASFQSQLDKIEASKYNNWLFGAGFFLLLTVSIGIWIVLSGHGDISASIGRLALTPFTVTGAIFCANQYIMRKRSKTDKDVDGGIKSGIDSVIDTAQKIIGLTKDK